MEPSKQCKFKDSLCKLLLKLFNTSDQPFQILGYNAKSVHQISILEYYKMRVKKNASFEKTYCNNKKSALEHYFLNTKVAQTKKIKMKDLQVEQSNLTLIPL